MTLDRLLEALLLLEGLLLAEEDLHAVVDDLGVVARDLDRGDGDDVLAFRVADAHRRLDLLLAGDLLDVESLAHRRQVQLLDDLVHHLLAGAYDQYLLVLLLEQGLLDLLAVGLVIEDGCLDRDEEVWIPLGGVSGEDLVALDKQAIIDDQVYVALLGDQLAVVALAGAAAAHEGIDFDAIDVAEGELE